MINVYGTNTGGIATGWTTKITSLLTDGEYAVYDSTDYFQAQGGLEWIIAEEDGLTRLNIAKERNFKSYQFNKGCGNLKNINVGEGLSLGCCSLIRPGSTIGDQVYIGAGTIIDINCNIGDGVTIGDNVTIFANVTIPPNTNIPSGSIVQSE